jgi:hypothetical protein
MDTATDTTSSPQRYPSSGGCPASAARACELLDRGEIESVHIGARRLLIIDSYRRLIERRRAADAK